MRFLNVLVKGLFFLTVMGLHLEIAQAQSTAPTVAPFRFGGSSADPIVPPDGEYRDGGSPGIGNPEANLQRPPYWDIRMGYAASGAHGGTPSGLDNGVGVGGRFLLNGADHYMNIRGMIAFGQSGVPYMSINSQTFRLRWALDSHNIFWVSAAPLDFEAHADSSSVTTPGRRGSFGYRPVAQIGMMYRLGGHPGSEHDDGGCLLQLFGDVGTMLGVHETQGSGVGQLLTGAEAQLACRHIIIDTQYSHLFGLRNSLAVNRFEADLAAIFPTRIFDIGPYLTTRVSSEERRSVDIAADPSDPARNRTFFDTTAGIRVRF